MRSQTHHALGTALILALMGALVGCGAPAPLTQLPSASRAPVRQVRSARLYTRGGEARLVVHRRSGRAVQGLLHAEGVRTLGRVNGLGYEVAAVSVVRLDAALAALRSDPSVAAVEPAYQMKASDQPTPVWRGFGLGVNDPLFASQYAPQMVRAPEAWNVTRGAGMTIAIVDSGIDPNHPEFSGKLMRGYNAIDHSANIRDDNGHGTHCAGIAAAKADNGIGIAGMAPEALIMPVKVLEADGSGSDVAVADGITWAADHGANVISLSLGGPGESRVLSDAVAYALAKGASVVAAMGNDGSDDLCYPAAAPGVIAVGAIDSNSQLASFSQSGSWISVVAPGVQILSTFPTYPCRLTEAGFPQNYAVLDGTSMAAPAVAGVAALIKARYGATLSPGQVKARLEGTTDRLNGLTTFDSHLGNGRVDAAQAVL